MIALRDLIFVLFHRTQHSRASREHGDDEWVSVDCWSSAAHHPSVLGDEHVVRAHIPHASIAILGQHETVGAKCEAAALPTLNRVSRGLFHWAPPAARGARKTWRQLVPLAGRLLRYSVIPWLSPVRNFFNRNACGRLQFRDATDRSASVNKLSMYVYTHDYVQGVSSSYVNMKYSI